MLIQKAKIENGKIIYNMLGKVKADEVESGVADRYYIHEQTTASSTWNITHGLGKYPSVTVFDSNYIVVYGYVRHINEFQCEIVFNFPFSGFAVCN